MMRWSLFMILYRMQRKKGQFASARPAGEEARSANSDGNVVPAQVAGPMSAQAEAVYVTSLSFSVLIWNFVDYGTIVILMINQGMTVIKHLLNV
jgi:hypothetical protein